MSRIINRLLAVAYFASGVLGHAFGRMETLNSIYYIVVAVLLAVVSLWRPISEAR